MTDLHPRTKRKGWQDCECCRRDFNSKDSWICPYCGFDNVPFKRIPKGDRISEDDPVVVNAPPLGTRLVEGRYVPVKPRTYLGIDRLVSEE